MIEENVLCSAELITPVHISRATWSSSYLFYPSYVLPRGGFFSKSSSSRKFWLSLRHALCFIAKYEAFLVKCLVRFYCLSYNSLSPSFLEEVTSIWFSIFSIQFLCVQVSKPPRVWFHFQSTFRSLVRTCFLAGCRKHFSRMFDTWAVTFLGCSLG